LEDKKSAIEFHQHTIINLIKMIKSEKAVVTAITTTFISYFISPEVNLLYHLISSIARVHKTKQRLKWLVFDFCN
jgi:hypothetical protein